MFPAAAADNLKFQAFGDQPTWPSLQPAACSLQPEHLCPRCRQRLGGWTGHLLEPALLSSKVFLRKRCVPKEETGGRSHLSTSPSCTVCRHPHGVCYNLCTCVYILFPDDGERLGGWTLSDMRPSCQDHKGRANRYGQLDFGATPDSWSALCNYKQLPQAPITIVKHSKSGS